MSTAVDAIYEKGFLQLLSPLPYPEHSRVRLAVELEPVAPNGTRNRSASFNVSGATTPITFLMSCSRHDTVLLPIPFTDLSSHHHRAWFVPW